LLFKNNDGWFRHCQEARRGNLFVIIVIARRYDVAICLFLVSIMRLLRSYFPRNDFRLLHCEAFLGRGNLFIIIVIARRHNVAICLFYSFTSWDYHVIRASFLVMTVDCFLARRHDVAICLFLNFNSWDYFGHTFLVMTGNYF
jgi:hypothetical protein